MNIEPLESRIAPAAVLTYTDVDGDFVTIKTSKGTTAELEAITLLAQTSPGRFQLWRIGFVIDPDFEGTDLSITAKRTAAGGDGRANAGSVAANGFDLGTVTIAGDLGFIAAGDGDADPGIRSLTVHSLGVYGITTQAPAGSTATDIAGPLGVLKVATDIHEASVRVTGGGIGSITIGGSLIGGSAAASGLIRADGAIGAVKIGGDLVGGAGAESARIDSVNAGIASITIGGSLRGGGDGSASLNGKLNIGALKIGGDVLGGAGVASAFIGSTDGALGSVTVGGSVIGSAAGFTAKIFARTTMGAVKIGGDLRGGGGGGSGGDSGFIQTATGNMGSVTIGGSVVGGNGVFCGAIGADTGATSSGDLGPVKIGGSVLAGFGAGSGRIFAAGDIASVKIGGSLVGNTGNDSAQVNAGGRLGAVSIAGDLEGSSGQRSGRLASTGGMSSVFVGGSVIGGSTVDAGSIDATQPFLLSVNKNGPITILGSLIGGSAERTGFIRAEGLFDEVGSVKIGGDIRGGSAQDSGAFDGGSKTASVTIGGSIVGGFARRAGHVTADTLGPVKVGGNLVGGSGEDSAEISSVTIAKSIVIAGSIIGGSGPYSGSLFSNGLLASIKIGGDLRGGDAGASNVTDSATIQAGRIGSVTIGGSIVGGRELGVGQVTRSGSIHAFQDLGSLVVKGSIIGGASAPVFITASGSANPTATTDLAIKSVTVGGRVELAFLIAGVDLTLAGTNADAQIGSVKVAGDWIASSLIAGVNTTDGRLGDGNDVKWAGAAIKDEAGIVSRIASISIGGQVTGLLGTPLNTFGFAAEQIAAFKNNGLALALTAGARNDTFAGPGLAGAALPTGPSLTTVVDDRFAVHVFEV